ncbi:hypothetical protein BZA70DRAFT_159544 [Myxozyma melibiosi]|uniref:Protein-lysine N-methyltransferase EFM4 n=1 Tax=Myxozyma melibiosi TaxID=54550 RepID=A0ABR1F6K1_9ASCO
MDKVEELNHSKLGTREYWDEFYSVEQNNFAENSDDEGEIWFADADAEDKVIDFLIDHTSSSEDAANAEFPFTRTATTTLDLGTGNGHLIFRVRAECGFMARLCGIDYAETSVTFANQILAKKIEEGAIEDAERNISFARMDFLTLPEEKENEGWDLVLDKGTLDAIALNREPVLDGKTGVQLYPTAVRDKLVRVGGIVLITSCNFTEPELLKIMDIEGFEPWETIKYPVYEFGGVKGQSISSVAFKRVK